MHGWPPIALTDLLTKSDDWIDLDPTATYREVTIRLWGKGVVLRREVRGDEINSRRRLLPPPVAEAASKLWGFASDQGRHGKESRKLEWAETLLVVGVAGTLCSYLNAKEESL